MKKCPFCAEEIQEGAIKCRFCGEFFMDKIGTTEQKVKWYYRTPYLIFGFLIVGPFILPVIWKNPRFSGQTKIVLTGLVLLLTYLLVQSTMSSLKNLSEYYRTYNSLLEGSF